MAVCTCLALSVKIRVHLWQFFFTDLTRKDRSQALAAGFQIHVAKPIEPETFVTSIASVLSPDNNRNQT